MRTRVIASAMVLSLSSAAAHADWKGKAEAGVVVARGNTDADTVNLKLDLTDELMDWKHAFSLAGLRATSDVSGGDNQLTAERYLAAWQTDYKFSDHAFSFGALRYESDRFSGFDYQASITAGLGYKFIDSEKVKFSGQLGAGYRTARAADTSDPPNEVNNDAVFTGALNFEDQFTPSTKLTNKFAVEAGSDDTLVANVISLEVKMTDSLALAVGLDARYHTNPPEVNLEPSKKLDTLTTVNLVYAF